MSSVFPSPAAIPNWPVIELDTDRPARLAATPKLSSKLCSHSPGGSHWLKLELPRLPYSDFIMILLPHIHFTQRQDPRTRKCLDIQLSNIFLAGQQLLEHSDRRVATGAPDQFTRSCPSCPNFWRMFSSSFDHIASHWRHPQKGDDDGTALCAEDQQRLMDRAGWSDLLAHLCALGWHFYLS